MILWWATPVECAAALARIDGEDRVWKPALQQGRIVLQSLVASATEIQPTEDLRNLAKNLVSKHPLRAADSLQLAAALFWREGYPRGASFVTLDQRLRIAAALEGFHVLPSVEAVHDSFSLGDGFVFELRDRAISD